VSSHACLDAYSPAALRKPTFSAACEAVPKKPRKSRALAPEVMLFSLPIHL
jgi:hypothetical protein